MAGSLPPRGAWIEIMNNMLEVIIEESLPPRGAWIEIMNNMLEVIIEECRSPRGERGLKYCFGSPVRQISRRSPRGERGLKYKACEKLSKLLFVAPPAGSVD